jgi:adenosylmethionine-8-amino-7-oxononanoate aminotransferase
VQETISREDLLVNVVAMGKRLDRGLRERLGQNPHIGDIRGRGLLQAVELVADRETKAPFDPALKLDARVKAAAMARGLMVYPMSGTIDGRRGDHVLIAPPYIIDETQIDTLVARLGDAIDAGLKTT